MRLPSKDMGRWCRSFRWEVTASMWGGIGGVGYELSLQGPKPTMFTRKRPSPFPKTNITSLKALLAQQCAAPFDGHLDEHFDRCLRCLK